MMVSGGKLHIRSLEEGVPYRIATTDSTVSIWYGTNFASGSIQMGLRAKGRGELVLEREGCLNLESFAPQTIHIVTRRGNGVVVEVEQAGPTPEPEAPESEAGRPMTLWERFRAVIR